MAELGDSYPSFAPGERVRVKHNQACGRVFSRHGVFTYEVILDGDPHVYKFGEHMLEPETPQLPAQEEKGMLARIAGCWILIIPIGVFLLLFWQHRRK